MTCCIPHCGSSRRKPGQEGNFALHEIPSDPDERASWLQAIKRDDWLPSTYSMVCSRHFVPSDYVEGKRRKLKKGAIPSIFWSMQPSNITKMKDAIRRKCSTPYSSEVLKKRQCLDTGSSQVTDATSSSTLDTPPTSSLCNEGAERIQIIWTSSASTGASKQAGIRSVRQQAMPTASAAHPSRNKARLTAALKHLQEQAGNTSELLYADAGPTIFFMDSEEFGFVLTRKFSSDAVESLFDSLRRFQGCNDQLNQNNVSHAASTSSGMTSAIRCIPPTVSAATPFQLPQSAAEILEKLSDPNVQYLPSLELSATAHVGGYIARVVQEHFSCFFCIPLLTKPKTNSALQGITNHLDRGGLLYPSDELAHLLNVLRMFAADVLSYNLRNWQPLETLVKFALPAVYDSPWLLCPTNNKAHRRELIHLVCTKFFRPLLVNYAFRHTDRNDRFKMFARKPLSRKLQKVR
ncbi:hypothetical protein HPB47_015108 [Ixodes persulcatus]|uniref:Uncharacterized protein n=1 Tax=Ixodes persulcatus TaxID=34615 RepID=A0AC60QVL0_IXOPE|nr:hypothetical protein HPB47_015108 [Ixodes persulcatus]